MYFWEHWRELAYGTRRASVRFFWPRQFFDKTTSTHRALPGQDAGLKRVPEFSIARVLAKRRATIAVRHY
jgi:hypothetical protein